MTDVICMPCDWCRELLAQIFLDEKQRFVPETYFFPRIRFPISLPAPLGETTSPQFEFVKGEIQSEKRVSDSW